VNPQSPKPPIARIQELGCASLAAKPRLLSSVRWRQVRAVTPRSRDELRRLALQEAERRR
jgi:hypothetical protein